MLENYPIKLNFPNIVYFMLYIIVFLCYNENGCEMHAFKTHSYSENSLTKGGFPNDYNEYDHHRYPFYSCCSSSVHPEEEDQKDHV